MAKAILVFIFGLLCFQATAQTANVKSDSTIIALPDSVKRHFPNKATMFSAVLPGLGQAYNKQIWKVPFIYGGFGGLGYGIYLYQKEYVKYRKAYFDLNDKNPKTTSYYQVLDADVVVDESNPTSHNSSLISSIETKSKMRDYYIIGTVGFYLFNILDANVNAHFIDFDISENLAFNIEPVGVNLFTSQPVYGLCLRYNF